MFLGIEIGGTKLQLGLGPGDGTLMALWRGDVVASQGAEGIRRQITEAVPELLSQAKLERSVLKGVGIGFGGPVDDSTRTVIKSHQIEGWDNFPLAEWIGELVGLPATLGNDADVAGLAEALFGAGKGLSPIFYITIGSGIGGGLIIDGKIYRGVGKGAAEIGHLRPTRTPVPPQEVSVTELLGRRSGPILEQLASGWALGRQAQRLARTRGIDQDSELFRLVCGQVERIEGKHVGEAAAKGDPLAVMVLRKALLNLAHAITHVIALLCPRRIIIGGGVSLLGEEIFFEPLRKLVARDVFKPFAACYDIVPAALGEKVVVHGALALARSGSSRTS